MNNDITLFWALEDLKFDAFERSFLFHIFRRGVCWETQANIATQTGMSAGKVNGLIQMLSKRKIIIRGKASNGREGWVVNESLVRSLHEQLQQNGRSSDEYHSPHERDIHHMNDDIHHMNDDIHHMNTKDNKEENKEEHSNAGETENDPLFELVQFFSELTHLPIPYNYHDTGREKWLDPFVSIYKATGDFERTKAVVRESIEVLRGKGYTIATPASLVTTAVSLAAVPSPQESGDDLALEFFEQVKAALRGQIPKDKIDPKARAAVANDTALVWDIKTNLRNDNERFIFARFKENLSHATQ